MLEARKEQQMTATPPQMSILRTVYDHEWKLSLQ